MLLLVNVFVNGAGVLTLRPKPGVTCSRRLGFWRPPVARAAQLASWLVAAVACGSPRRWSVTGLLAVFPLLRRSLGARASQPRV